MNSKHNTNIMCNQLIQSANNESCIERNPIREINIIKNTRPNKDINENLIEINAALAFIKRQNTDIFNQNDQILQNLKTTNNSIENTLKTNQLPKLPCSLPVTTFQHVTQLEEYLQNENNVDALVKY